MTNGPKTWAFAEILVAARDCNPDPADTSHGYERGIVALIARLVENEDTHKVFSDNRERQDYVRELLGWPVPNGTVSADLRQFLRNHRDRLIKQACSDNG